MAVHVLTVLGHHEGDRVTSTLLAASVNTNPVIIRRLLLDLQRARLVDTCRGAGAGSRLNRSPRRINLAEVYRAIEPSRAFAAFSRRPASRGPEGAGVRRAVEHVFASAQDALEGKLEKTTLADLIRSAGTHPHKD